jgi:hypothetical protein
MPSPFPGMNPYLEAPAVWEDFHGELTYACRRVLLDRLPPAYDASVSEQVRLVEVSRRTHGLPVAKSIRPDVAVVHKLAARKTRSPTARPAGTAVLDPVTIAVPEEEEQEIIDRWIEIRYRPDGSLVTVIEVLSPSNKNPEGFDEYRAKRRALLRQRVNLVEIDLLIGGRRTEPPELLPQGDYYTTVSRRDRLGVRDVYAWSVRRTLPVVHVPLRAPEPDVDLDLASAFTIAFERGEYERRLRYGGRPPAPLRREDAEWAMEVVRETEASS